jgi:uncharacterized flavoprotein (TIGR03862 family)
MSGKNKTIAVIGAGPAGLMAAETLSEAGFTADVYDAMPSAGRKFLIAGKGGMNITHSEALPLFLSRYSAGREALDPILRAFPPDTLRNWVKELGFDTFIGSSGRVFPTDMKAAPLLRAWLHRLRIRGVHFHMRHRWLGWNGQYLIFEQGNSNISIRADAVILALGGGSWPQLGSNANWVSILQKRGVDIAELLAANCGFEIQWSEHIRSRFAGHAIKPVVLSFIDQQGLTIKQQGELVVTEHGLEGSLIYALSAPLRALLAMNGKVNIELDLSPTCRHADLLARLSRPKGKLSWSNYLRKRGHIDGVKAGLLRESLPANELWRPECLANKIKALPITLTATRPLPEAISTAGGVRFSALEQDLMLKASPGVFCAGEMLDWDAPTGGYLLTACFASGRAAGLGAINWLKKNK